MANLKDIKLRITSIQKTQQITRAMKMVAASKMKRATDAIVSLRPFADKLQHFMSNLNLDEELVSNLIQSDREVQAELLIVIAGDKGLCGGFNANVRKVVQAKLAENNAAGVATKMIVVGKKTVEFCKKFDSDIVESYSDIFKDIQFIHASDMVAKAKAMYESEDVDRVLVIYNKFVNAITQTVETDQLLPLEFDAEEQSDQLSADYIFEPSKAELLASIIPKYLNTQVWRSLLESNASEQAARMMAMENATNNAGDLIIQLRKEFNKIRQASITTEISEIVGGAAALQD